MLDLISTTEETHYEAYRQAQMETRKFGEPKVKKLDNPKFKEEEEMLRKRFTEQVKLEEARFRQWEQHVCFRIRSRVRVSIANPQASTDFTFHLSALNSFSSSLSVIVSTRISKLLTVQSRVSNQSCK